MKKHSIPRAGIMALALCLALALTACGNNQTGENRRPEDDPNAPVHTITLNPNGGAWADGSTEPVTVSVREGTAIDFAANTPDYEGNILYGWYLEDGSPWPGAQKVSGDVTLKAKWSVEEVVETYDLVLTLNGETIPLTYENGVYQFNCFTPLYYNEEGGGVQHGGLFTLYMEQFQPNMDADDGTAKRLLYRAKSSDQETTGACVVAEFFNDGEFDITYDLIGAIHWNARMTNTRLATGTWSYAGYTPAFDPEPIPEGLPLHMTAPGGVSPHWDSYDPTLVALGGPRYPVEYGEALFSVPAAEDARTFITFFDNNTLAIFRDASEFGFQLPVAHGNWTAEDGSVAMEVEYTPMEVTDAGDGNVQFSLQGSTFTIPVGQLAGNY